MISIELISKGEPVLLNTLDSIFGQDYDDFEVVCVDSSNNVDIWDYSKEHNVKLVKVPIGTRALRARYEAHAHSIGELSLLLDSTRPLKANVLKELAEKFHKFDMTIIKEDSIGHGFWVSQSAKIKEISEKQAIKPGRLTPAFLLPRLYKSAILTDAFHDIKGHTEALFDQISYGEHQLIFEYCRKYATDLGMTQRSLLSHYEDASLTKIIKKYHWYGKSQKTLDHLKNADASRLISHIRRNVSFSDRISTLPITIARSVPFLFGYFLF